jgi:hypothetical protein
MEVAPGQAISLTVVADDPNAVEGTADVIYDLDDIEVKPDKDAVWNAILNASLAPEHNRTIKVIGFEEWFVPATDVLAIAIDFENGDSVVLRPNKLEVEGNVRVSLADLILRKAQDSEYRYTQVIVRQSGQERSQRSDTLDLLFPQV